LRIEPGEQSVPPLWDTHPASSGPSYLGLLLVIVLGVAGGNLLSNWITATIVERRMEIAAQKALKIMRATTAQTAQAQRDAVLQVETARAADHERIIQARSVDPVGVKLNRQCEDWKRMSDQMKSPTADLEAQKSCTRYRKYLEMGRLD